MVEATYGSECEVWKSSRRGLEHGSHMSSKTEPSAVIPEHCIAEVPYVVWSFHNQVGVGPHARTSNRETCSNESCSRYEGMPRPRRRVRESDARAGR